MWYILIGLLMLTRGLSKTLLQKLPFTPAIIYLIIGLILGPSVLGFFNFDPIKRSLSLEILTEVAVLISLFSAGLKMPVPIKLKYWSPSVKLATLSVVITCGLIAAFSYFVLRLDVGASILIGAILAPTDPVLATDVQSRYLGDQDQLRFTLTSEAGLNDGTAFPFVMLGLGFLGLHELGGFGIHWIIQDVLWGTLASVIIGIAGGVSIGITVWKIRGKHNHDVLDDLVGLGLIGLVYGVSSLLNAWGFLAVFFAAISLRHIELKLAKAEGVKPEQLGAGVEEPIHSKSDDKVPTAVSIEALVFKEHLERLSELVLVLLVGGMLNLHLLNWQAVCLAFFVFVLARPISVLTALIKTDISWSIRGAVSWFGIRGIGSIYYLMYAIQHGLSEAIARDVAQFTLTVVALSIFVHGISVKPMLHAIE
jgi:sodium/hydrogen antiporter